MYKKRYKILQLNLLSAQEKVLVNTTVKFNIHGVFYTKTTDKYGVASLAII